MDKLEEQTWKRFIKTRKISEEEIADEEFCKKMRGTTDYAVCRYYVAWCNFWNAILDEMPSFIQRWLGK